MTAIREASATSALQTTGNTSAASIDAKIPSGLVVTAGKLQVQLPAGGSGLTDTELRATAVPVTANAGTNLNTSALNLEATQSALNTKIPSGLVVTAGRLQVELPAGGSGLTNTELRATAVPVSLTSTTITGSVAVTGSLTDTQLRATAVPVSGTVTSNIGTTNGLALDATLTGGTQKAIARTAAKGATVAADVTSTPVDANTQAMDVSVKGAVTTNATLTAETTKVIGTVNISAAQSVTANAGTNLNTSALALDATLTGGTQKAIARGGAKGTTVAGDLTSTPVDANTQALDVSVKGSAAVTGTFWQATQPVSGPLTDTQLRATAVPISGTVILGAGVAEVGKLAAGVAVIGALVANQSVNNAQIGGVAVAVGSGVTGTGVQRMVLATDVILPAQSESRAATLHVTATAAVNTAITATLPAPAAGLFHYITSVELVKLYAVIGVAAGAGVLITSTNLPGSPIWTTEQSAGAAGSAPKVITYTPTTPLKSALAATATTFVAPAQLQTIWRWNISYFTAV